MSKLKLRKGDKIVFRRRVNQKRVILEGTILQIIINVRGQHVFRVQLEDKSINKYPHALKLDWIYMNEIIKKKENQEKVLFT